MSTGAEKFPASLPSPLLRDYKVDRDPQKLRTDVEGGPPRVRRESSQRPEFYQANFIFSNDQYQLFRGYWEYILNGGSFYFFMDINVGGGITEERVRFVGEYSAAEISDQLWTVQAKIEIAQPSLPSADDIYGQVYDEAYVQALEAAASNLDLTVVTLDDLIALEIALTALPTYKDILV